MRVYSSRIVQCVRRTLRWVIGAVQPRRRRETPGYGVDTKGEKGRLLEPGGRWRAQYSCTYCHNLETLRHPGAIIPGWVRLVKVARSNKSRALGARPSKVTADELLGRAKTVMELWRSGTQADRKAIVRLYVLDLVADPATRSITGTLVDPLMAANTKEGPEPNGSGPSICSYMVAPKGCVSSAYRGGLFQFRCA